MDPEQKASPPVEIYCIVTATDFYGRWAIGNEGEIPWRCPPDIGYFNKTTTETESEFKANAVIMSRKVWENIPKNFRPLDDRLNIIISSKIFDGAEGYENYSLPPAVKVFPSLSVALQWLKEDSSALRFLEKIFVIGGAQLYMEAFARPECTKVYFTEIEPATRLESYDAFFPELTECCLATENENEKEFQEDIFGNKFRFLIYRKDKKK